MLIGQTQRGQPQLGQDIVDRMVQSAIEIWMKEAFNDRNLPSVFDDVVKGLAEDIHRKDLIIPDEILDRVRELRCLGYIPQRYRALLADGFENGLGMIVVTEELTKGSRRSREPDNETRIVARLYWMEAQRRKKAVAKIGRETLCAIAITEPDFGSDVAS